MDDEKIGANVARLRGARSQKEVADAMKKLGFKWSQSTVSDVESGRRPLKMSEGYALAAIFDLGSFGIDSFMQSDAAVNFRQAARSLGQRDASLKEAMKEWWADQFHLAIWADAVRKSDGGLTGHERLVADTWVTRTMDQVVQEAWARYQAEGVEELFTEDYLEKLPEGTTFRENAADAERYRAEIAADPDRQYEAKLHEAHYGKPEATS